MVKPVQRRIVVNWAKGAYQVSERRACRALSVHRSVVRYRSRKPAREPLRRRLRELAAVRLSWGFRRLHILLRREGWRVNHKLVYRLYTEEGLTLKAVRPKRRKSVLRREGRPTTTAENERWAMDFIHDRLVDGRTVRILSVLDVHTRECVALVARQSFRGEDVGRALSRVAEARKLPPVISVDQGTEFTSRALDAWAYQNQVKLDFSRPGKPTDNAHVEAFHGSLRRELLSQHWWVDPAEVQQVLDGWREDYNNVRPHSSLALEPPVRTHPSGRFVPTRERLRI
jgi:putative transposase